jgi:hypothetical protein
MVYLSYNIVHDVRTNTLHQHLAMVSGGTSFSGKPPTILARVPNPWTTNVFRRNRHGAFTTYNTLNPQKAPLSSHARSEHHCDAMRLGGLSHLETTPCMPRSKNHQRLTRHLATGHGQTRPWFNVKLSLCVNWLWELIWLST